MLVTTRQEPPEVSRTTVISSLEDATALAAEARLLNSPYVELRRVSCEFHEGILTLRGRVPRYYLKQIAQNVVSQLSGVVEIDNQLDVAAHASEPEAERRR
jgi:osmotically-inducible protein OsmY